MALKDARESDPQNIKKRVWNKSLPVVHLCAAIQCMLQQLERFGTPIDDFVYILMNRVFLDWIIPEAEKYEPLFDKSKLKITPDKLIKFRIIN